jgi:spore coat polysaccharide biosynthesis protein SpsF
MIVAAIVQARLKSSRLPGKTMLQLKSGKTAVCETLERCGDIVGVTHVVAAVPDTLECDFMVEHISRSVEMRLLPQHRFSIIRGPELDVLARYAIAAQMVHADIICRITSDCPLIRPEICSTVIRKLIDDKLDYCSNCWPRTYPHGYDCEAFTRRVLDEAYEKSTHPMCREHVTPYFNGSFPEDQMENVLRGNVEQDINESEVRLTLDTVDDYIRISNHMVA